MIAKVFWDLDEVLMHSITHCPNQVHEKFKFPNENYTTHFMFRPNMAALEFSRSIVGHANNFILTTSTLEYATKANEIGKLLFPVTNIIAREHLEEYLSKSSSQSKFSSEFNVLIDDKPPREQFAKIGFLGLNTKYHSQYLQVHPYFGVNFPNDPFDDKVISFLKNIHNDA